jgi:hypothetical protein
MYTLYIDAYSFIGYITINNKNSFGMTNSMDSTTLKSLPATRSIKKPSTTSVLTAYSPTKTATLVQEPKETTIFLNHLS